MRTNKFTVYCDFLHLHRHLLEGSIVFAIFAAFGKQTYSFSCNPHELLYDEHIEYYKLGLSSFGRNDKVFERMHDAVPFSQKVSVGGSGQIL